MSSLNEIFLSFTTFIFTLAAIPSSSDSSKKNESPTAGAPGFVLGGFGFGVGFGLGLSPPESAAADVPFLGAAFGSWWNLRSFPFGQFSRVQFQHGIFPSPLGDELLDGVLGFL